MRGILNEQGISVEVLFLLYEHSLGFNELDRLCQEKGICTRKTLIKYLKKLNSLKLVEDRKDEKHQQRKIQSLTPRGIQLVRQIHWLGLSPQTFYNKVKALTLEKRDSLGIFWDVVKFSTSLLNCTVLEGYIFSESYPHDFVKGIIEQECLKNFREVSLMYFHALEKNPILKEGLNKFLDKLKQEKGIDLRNKDEGWKFFQIVDILAKFGSSLS